MQPASSKVGEYAGVVFLRLVDWFYGLGIGFWQSGNVWSAIANHDLFAGSDANKALVLANLDNVYQAHPASENFGCV